MAKLLQRIFWLPAPLTEIKYSLKITKFYKFYIYQNTLKSQRAGNIQIIFLQPIPIIFTRTVCEVLQKTCESTANP